LITREEDSRSPAWREKREDLLSETAPEGVRPFMVRIDDLVLDQYAPRALPSGGLGELKNSGVPFEQRAGIWDLFGSMLSDGDSWLPECQKVFDSPFPLGQPRPPPRDVACAAKYCAGKQATTLIAEWSAKWSELVEIKNYVRSSPENANWLRSAHPSVQRIVKGFDPSFFKLAARQVGIDVSTLTHLFQRGSPIIGEFSAPGVYCDLATPRGKPRDPLAEAADRWAELPKLFRRDSDRAALWESAMAEVQMGWLGPPVPADAVDKASCRPVRRFGVSQSGKLRACDNCRRSGTNNAAMVLSKLRLPMPEDLAEVASIVGGRKTGVDVFICDHRSAFKQLPVFPGHSDLALVTLARPADGAIFCFRPRTLVFGASAAVLGYNVVARTIASVFVRLFNIPVVNFFDDFAGAFPTGAGRAAADYFVEFCSLLGFECKVEKTEAGPALNFLGIHVDCAGVAPVLSLPEDKRLRYGGLVRDILLRASCRPDEAASLAGRLNFATGALWGRGPRVFIKPLYRQSEGVSNAISTPLRAALNWWESYLGDPKARTYSSPSTKISGIIHTDASLRGIGVAWLPRNGRPRVFASSVSPGSRPLDKKGGNRIYLLELTAALAGAELLSTLVSDGRRNVVFGVDNNAALVALLRGHGSSALATELVARFWAAVEKSKSIIWIDRVRSKANRADRPSRLGGGGGNVECVTFPPL